MDLEVPIQDWLAAVPATNYEEHITEQIGNLVSHKGKKGRP